jgi:glycerophosphoryl diester phosphodiesterase
MSSEQVLSRYKSGVAKRRDGKKPVTVAHRGNHRFAPENTLVSYREAIATGAPIMEIDLRLSADGKAVLMHDETVDRTTNAKGPVSSFTAAELAQLDAGSWKHPNYAGEPVPTLEQVADLCRGRAIMMLDLKPTGLGPAIAETLARISFPPDQVILAPWEDDDGKHLRGLMPDMPMVRLGEMPSTFDDAYFDRMKTIGFSGFSFSWRTLSLPFIEQAHRHGMKVYTWTVNDPADVSGAVLAGVDGIITDDPRATLEMINVVSSGD